MEQIGNRTIVGVAESSNLRSRICERAAEEREVAGQRLLANQIHRARERIAPVDEVGVTGRTGPLEDHLGEDFGGNVGAGRLGEVHMKRAPTTHHDVGIGITVDVHDFHGRDVVGRERNLRELWRPSATVELIEEQTLLVVPNDPQKL